MEVTQRLSTATYVFAYSPLIWAGESSHTIKKALEWYVVLFMPEHRLEPLAMLPGYSPNTSAMTGFHASR
jgi:hypothetical protein